MGRLADKVASKDEINQAIFAQGFGGITDIEDRPMVICIYLHLVKRMVQYTK